VGKKGFKSDRKIKKTRSPNHFLSFLFLLLIIFLLFVYFWITFPDFVGNNRNASLKLPLVLKYIDNGLYQKDFEIDNYYSNYPRVAIWIWANLYIFSGDFKPVFGLLFLILSIIFLSGLYVLTFKLTGSSFCSLLMVFLSIPERQILGVEQLWGLSIFSRDPFSNAMLFSLTPWLFYVFISNCKNRKIISVLFFILALLAHFDSLISIHLFILITIVAFIIEKRISKWIKIIYIPVCSFIIGTIPYLILNFSYIKDGNFPFGSNIPDINNVPLLSSRLLFDIIPILIIAIFICLQYPKEKISLEEKLILGLLILSIIIPLISLFLNEFIFWKAFKFNEISRYFYMTSLIFVSFYLGHTIKSRSGYHKFLPILVVLILLFPATYIHPVRSYFEFLIGKQVVSVSPERASSIPQQEIKDFLEMCVFCLEKTGKDSIFLINPSYSYSFRLYAKRSMVISADYKMHKNFSKSLYEKWHDLFNEVNLLYGNPSTSQIKEFARNHKIDYVIIGKSSNTLMLENSKDLDMVFSNQRYLVIQTSKFFY